ncbi:DUF421 domain-containing protein [Oceaniglobus roseus]|uniref:DUF421 domain-containing protein n=1 Tax=Oceaniglobus roseus TaxID=1737570 RepID=UPI001FE9F402|nr:YetF domain-containing protein [Kandeliimicrobium roseum]
MDYLDPLWRAAVAVALVIVLTRINGLRSFSKMSGFDFVSTVAIGSLLATTLTSEGKAFVASLVALVGIFLVQGALSRVRRRSDRAETALDNEPLLLMQDGVLLERNLDKANITRSDVMAKLRKANALDLGRVRAVVLETTGDVSVIQGDAADGISPEVMADVRR